MLEYSFIEWFLGYQSYIHVFKMLSIFQKETNAYFIFLSFIYIFRFQSMIRFTRFHKKYI